MTPGRTQSKSLTEALGAVTCTCCYYLLMLAVGDKGRAEGSELEKKERVP